MVCFNIRELLRTRADQRSFHIAAEQHVRVEFRNMASGGVIQPLRYDGDLVLTCYQGAFVIKSDEETMVFGEMDQAVAPANSTIAIECSSTGTLQIIWA